MKYKPGEILFFYFIGEDFVLVKYISNSELYDHSVIDYTNKNTKFGAYDSELIRPGIVLNKLLYKLKF